MNKQKQAARYRPVLTAEQIAKVLDLAKLEQPMSDTSMQLIGILAPFKAKIDNQGILPAYSVEPKVSMLQSLGEDPSQSVMSKEDYWFVCYKKYVATHQLCTLDEIAAAREHMYLNDLMTPEEMEEFEKQETS